MEPINWGILGTGKINRSTVPAIRMASNANLTAIASRSKNRAQDAANNYNIPKFYSTYQDLLEDETIDAVYLPLPNHIHKEWVIKAAKEGKHVLCEKPFALSESDAREMVAVCQNNDVMVMEAFMYRFNPIISKIREILNAGTIGELKAVEFTFAHDLLGYVRNGNNYRYHKANGGGALLDLGVYGLNFCNFLIGSSPRLISSIGRGDNDSDIDLFSQLLLTYQGNITCQITSSFDYYGRNLLISGSIGSIQIDDLVSTQENKIVVKTSDSVDIISLPPFNHYAAQIEHFSQSILENTEPKLTPDEIYNVIRIVEQSLESMIWIDQ